MIEGLIEHMERHLGTMSDGWSRAAKGAPAPFQIGRFTGGAPAGVTVLTTLGLSDTVLSQGEDRRVRVELVLLSRREEDDGLLAGILSTLGDEILARGMAPAIGSIIGPVPPLREVSTMDSFFVTAPVYQPPGLTPYMGGGTAVVFAWLCPIADDEIAFVNGHGPGAFMDLLDAVDPDLTDLRRGPVIT